MNEFVNGVMIGHMAGGGLAQKVVYVRDHAQVASLQKQLQEAEAEGDEIFEYARNLRAHLNARKMSENDLLDALRKENAGHPLANDAAFEAIFQTHLAEQYKDMDTATDERRSQVGLQVDAELKEAGGERDAIK